ncbi:hypothetical protein SAMN04489860_2428 [Paraoerskovia marina]|uniref:Secreted protein n=1 Tax=Paraoerskovia marina TaxID=545619 RepID=A0A1H1V8N3_9CELL|nr:hypothetical protein [Paraoerskovia marina]SDS81147.1 hypothetical protein SAMN04489860_2428 [Paraoerskovia marina]
MRIVRSISAGVAALALVAAGAGAATAKGNPDICRYDGEGWMEKVDVSGNHQGVQVDAPDGLVIVGYCVKAGSSKGRSGGGQEVNYLDDGVDSLTITHSSGKDVSHYQVLVSEGYVIG